MRRTKQWLATAAMLLSNAISVYAQIDFKEITFAVHDNQGPLFTAVSPNEKGVLQYEYTSDILTLDAPVNVLYFRFMEGYSTNQYLLDRNGFPFVALAEFQLYDANGKVIDLDARNFCTNAQERSEGPIADICDGNRTTYFHSVWGAGASDFHYLRIALSDTISAFSFKYCTRNTIQCVPKQIAIAGEYSDEPYAHIVKRGTCGDAVSWTLTFDGHLVISGEGDMVKEQGLLCSPWANYFVRKVTIENGITSIFDEAFRFCKSLTSVSIPASVSKITADSTYSRRPTNPFYGCYRLSSIEVDEDNPVFDSRDNCNAIIKTATNALITGCQTTRIPEGIASIESEAFGGCYRLTELYLPQSVASIEQDEFRWPFIHCNLKKIIVAEGNPVYDSRHNCNAIIRTQDSTLILGSSNTVFPVGVTRIGGGAFVGCIKEDMIIPEGITSIEDWAFGPSGLKAIFIPASVTEIGEYTFGNLGGALPLVSITVDEANEVYDSRNNCNAIIETATNTLVRGSSSTVIPDGIERIGRFAFYGTELKSIIIPEGVVEIKSNAFSCCDSLTSITIPESMTRIGNGAFNACNNLTSITIPRNVSEIGASAFFGCKNLTAITISKGVGKIGNQAFTYCGMTSIIIPESVTEIEFEAFRDCSELTKVILPKRFKGREDIFVNCNKLKKIHYKNK